VRRSILREALAVALEARGHQASAIALTADQGIAVTTSYQPEARRPIDPRFPDGGEPSPFMPGLKAGAAGWEEEGGG
jgi:hypothetical protein